MNYMKINKLMLGMVIAFLFMGLLTSQTNAENTVKGTNVTKVEIGRAGTPVEYRLVQSGPKEWTQNHANGNLYVKYTETARDEWSVYLKSSRFSSVIINLWLKTFVMKEGSGVVYTGKVLSSSNTATTNTSTTTNTNANLSLEQQCFKAIQGKVAYDKTGNKNWGAGNVQKLCKGTTNPANTIACFKKEIQTHNQWSRGVEACRVGGNPVAKKPASIKPAVKKPAATSITRSYAGKAQISKFTVNSNKRPTPIVRSAANPNTTLKNVAYGIFVKTWNPTISPPEVQIYGTKGKSNILILDNKVDNLNKNGSDYYLFSGLEFKDIGVPIVIAFKPTSKDGWGFEGIEVDYFEGKSPTWNADQWVRSIKDTNSREVARRAVSKANIRKIDFPGRKGLDADEGVDQNIKHEKVVAIVAAGSELNPKNPNSADSTGRNPIRLQTDFEIIDTRYSLPGEFRSSQIRRLTQEDILTAVDTYAIQNSFSNTTTIGVSLETELNLFGQKVSTTFSVDNETTVAENQTSTNQATNSNTGVEVSESGSGQTYKVPSGNFFLIDITYSTVVERYEDFAGLIRIKPVQSVTATLKGVNYRVECWSGELRRVETLTSEDFQGITQFGPYLKDQPEILSKIKSYKPNFSTKTTPGKNCYKPAV